jgi:ABC-type multidrug transport system ATPase subunit
MIQIELDQISKRYGYQSILKNINLILLPSSKTGISGRNGSGKSTMLKIISSYLSPSSGKITYKAGDNLINRNQIALEIAFCAPYIQVTQEMSLKEVFSFQSKFIPFYNNIDYKSFLDIIEMKSPKDKEIKFFSSGMQQKVNLGLTILRQSKILLLDEPTSYLDVQAKAWFHKFLHANQNDRTIVIASNDKDDFNNLNDIYNIESIEISKHK